MSLEGREQAARIPLADRLRLDRVHCVLHGRDLGGLQARLDCDPATGRFGLEGLEILLILIGRDLHEGHWVQADARGAR